MSERQILLPLTASEASAVAVALVGLIHDMQNGPNRWSYDASAVAVRLEELRDAVDGEQ